MSVHIAGNTAQPAGTPQPREPDPDMSTATQPYAVPGAGSGPRKWVRDRARGINLGPLPVLLGIVAIWIVFQLLNDRYLSSRNLSNIVLQAGVTGLLAIGVVLVLLIGEIDLSLGATAGVAADVLGVGLADHGWPTPVALIAAVATGAAIGLLQGAIIVWVGVPSFLVTLGGLLAWQGVQLALLGSVGERRVTDRFVRGIANQYLPPVLAWILLAAAVLGYAAIRIARRRSQSAAGLAPESIGSLAGRVVAVAVVGVIAVGYLQRYFGVPWLLLILLVVAWLLTVLTRRTPLGRHLYAIGGNAEASRRAGIPVARTRLIVFVLASGLAGLAGIVAASRQFSVSSGTGGGTLLLEAIAAAVIGGTSLFGGRGRIFHALLGALVIVSVSNGLDLLGEPSSVKNIATGAILVLAVSLDSVTRRRRNAAGE